MARAKKLAVALPAVLGISVTAVTAESFFSSEVCREPDQRLWGWFILNPENQRAAQPWADCGGPWGAWGFHEDIQTEHRVQQQLSEDASLALWTCYTTGRSWNKSFLCVIVLKVAGRSACCCTFHVATVSLSCQWLFLCVVNHYFPVWVWVSAGYSEKRIWLAAVWSPASWCGNWFMQDHWMTLLEATGLRLHWHKCCWGLWPFPISSPQHAPCSTLLSRTHRFFVNGVSCWFGLYFAGEEFNQH